MKENFKAALEFVMAHECVFAAGHYGDLAQVVAEEVPGDHGGLTKFGIDQASHPHLNIKALDYQGAAQLYRDGEWAKCRCDELPEGLDVAVFDTAVNLGAGRAIKLLQQACNDAGTEPPLVVDGFIGPKTLFVAMRTPTALPHFLELRQQRYDMIIERDISQVRFSQGWRDRVLDLRIAVNRYKNSKPAEALA